MARAPEHSIVPPTITLTTRNRPELKSDGSDCTNPQQGTVRSRTCMEKLPPSNGLAAARLETPVTVSGESDDQSTAMTKASYDENGDAKPISSSNHHHLVEPRPRLKIPPTLRDSRKLFVGGLPLDVTSHEFLEFFQRFGTVMDSVVMYDRTTRKSRGFGFVTFADPQVAARILQMGRENGEYGHHSDKYPGKPRSGRMEMRGKMIEIKAAQPKEEMPPSRYHYPKHHLVSPGPPMPSVRESRPMPYGPEHYEHVAKHPATLPARHPGPIYGYQLPSPPVPYFQSDPVMTPVTPQQAAFDMAHHMMFYSHLLATPTLMSPLMSPMVPPSPMVMGYERQPSYREYFQPFQEPQGQAAPAGRQVPRSPIPPVAKVSRGEPFKIGGANFFPEEPSSPTLHPAKPGIQNLEQDEQGTTIRDATRQ